VGVSRIRLNIDRLVLNGFEQHEARALSEALRLQLSHVLADQTARHDWVRPHRTPVVKVGAMPLEQGPLGAGKLGRRIGLAVGKGLKP
jgi:hypothetical protein